MNKITDINSSIWVSASAGSGKTKSLVDRVVSLLAHGVDPANILCITFTKNAAQEMKERVSNRLIELAKLSKSEYAKFEHEIGLKRNVPLNLEKIIQSVNENKLSIQTIHSFCQNALASISYNSKFSIMDDFAAEKLLKEAYLLLLDDKEIIKNLSELVYRRGDLFDLIVKYLSNIRMFFYKFEVDSFEKIENVFDLFFERNYTDFDAYINNYIKKSLIDVNGVDRIRQAFKENFQNAEFRIENLFLGNLDGFFDIFLKKDGSPKERILKKEIVEKYDIMDEIEKLKNLFYQVNEKINSEKTRLFNVSFFKICKKLLDNYEKLKAKNNFCDFDDLLYNTVVSIVTRQDCLYKIYGNFEHVLIDEAQDISSLQWEIVMPLFNEFYSHMESNKTIFVVGDSKQSIYSFQGADFSMFRKMHGFMKQKCEACKQSWYDISLTKSYRSSKPVIDFVNQNFKDTFQDGQHSTARENEPGMVSIFPLVKFDEKENRDEDSKVNVSKILAEKIAGFIKEILDSKIIVPSRKRRVTPKDFLVLFQHRKGLMKDVSSEILRLGIPCSGADTTAINEELIIEDLIALAEFSLFQKDDLLFARVLKGAFINITEAELFNLCKAKKTYIKENNSDKSNASLWDFFLENGKKYIEHFYKIRKSLLRYLELSNCSAHDFFLEILVSGDAQILFEKFSENGKEIFFDFLDLCLDFKNKGYGDLQAFLREIRDKEIVVKKNISLADDCVHLMTAHASKGLQAPIVIIADADFYNVKIGDVISINDFCLVPLSSAPNSKVNTFKEAAKENNRRESQRLMYVAMTRAEDYLAVFAKQGAIKINQNSWYSLIKNSYGLIENYDDVLKRSGVDFEIDINVAEKENIDNHIQIPERFFEKYQIKERKISDKSEESSYGEFVHFLLQWLPKINKNNWREYAFANNHDLDDTEFEKAYREAVATLTSENLARFFVGENFNELQLYDVENNKELRVDKICISDDELCIIDFKTGVPGLHLEMYKQQLKRYRNCISKIFPGKIIRAIIIWTKTNETTELSFD